MYTGGDIAVMFFPRFIKWLVGLPAPYGLGLLWWGEVTILLCSLIGVYLLSNWGLEKVLPKYEGWLFPGALLAYLVIFYIIHFEFGKVSQLMESLMHIHRMGGLLRIERLRAEVENSGEVDTETGDDDGKVQKYDPLAPPDRIRASAQVFQIRYFVVLPTALLLYLLSFAGTIYRLFTRQILAWEPAGLAMSALGAVIVACLCYWLLMPNFPGYVSIRQLLEEK